MDEDFEWLKNYKMEDSYLLREERINAKFLSKAEKNFIKVTSVIPPYDPWGRLDTGLSAFKKLYTYIRSKEGGGTYSEIYDMITSVYAVSELISTSIEILTAHCPKVWDKRFLEEILFDKIRERYFFTNSPLFSHWDATSYILGVVESLKDAITELETRIATRDKLAVYKITSFEECFMCCTADTRYAISRLEINY